MRDEQRKIDRREFLRWGLTGLGAATLSGWAEEVWGQIGGRVGKLPKRRYGRTGLDISVIVGAATWPEQLVPLALQAGVNYWHKAQQWRTLPEALRRLPRESYYLECVVDRVGGTHETGRIDEESHYRFVKECIQRSGVGYFDVFKFHFGYHSVQEAKTELGMVRAFERLKKEGLVKHLAISQHSYTHLPGGQPNYEILEYLITKTPYEAAQFFYTYGDRKEVEEVIALAKKHNFGTIAMKTLGGVGRASRDPNFMAKVPPGTSPAAAVIRWVASNPNLTALVVELKNVQQLEEDLGALRTAFSPQDGEMLHLLAAYNQGAICLLCDACVSRCPEHIAVAEILRYERYAQDYGEVALARRLYGELPVKASSCLACGACLEVCPANIPIPQKLDETHRLLG